MACSFRQPRATRASQLLLQRLSNFN
ncbi:hypothetical protein SEVIR_6G076801v4 [Setaria viridis]